MAHMFCHACFALYLGVHQVYSNWEGVAPWEKATMQCHMLARKHSMLAFNRLIVNVMSLIVQ